MSATVANPICSPPVRTTRTVPAVTTSLTLGNATVEVECETRRGVQGRGYARFNTHDPTSLPLIVEAARLISEAHPPPENEDTADDIVFVTVETATMEIAHELRSVQKRNVLTISRTRPEAGDMVLNVDVSSSKPKTLYLPSRHAEIISGKQVVLFDNVIASGSTLCAAAQLCYSAGCQNIVSAIVMYTDGQATTLAYTEHGEIPVVSLGGELPSVPLAAGHERREYIRLSEATFPTADGEVRFLVYGGGRHGDHAIAVVGRGGVIPDTGRAVPVRIHDACMTSECFRSAKCDCNEQLELALRLIQQEERGGVVIYLLQEGRGIGLAAKIAAYSKQEQEGLDTVEANRALGLPDDCRSYVAARDILSDLDISSVALITNNPRKIDSLTELGVQVDERIPAWAPGAGVSAACRRYMAAKVARMGHKADIPVLFYEPEDENGVLSNLWMDPDGQPVLEWQGKPYRSAEHAYQATKARLLGRPDADIEAIANAADGHIAFAISRDLLGNSSEPVWTATRVSIMREILRAKAKSCPAYRAALVAIGGRTVKEASPTDSFWGAAPGPDGEEGQNVMGHLTMEVAAEIATGSDSATTPAPST